MTGELVALLDGEEIGCIQRDARGRIKFVYDDSWRKTADAHPPSLSMPLGAKEHGRCPRATCSRSFLMSVKIARVPSNS